MYALEKYAAKKKIDWGKVNIDWDWDNAPQSGYPDIGLPPGKERDYQISKIVSRLGREQAYTAKNPGRGDAVSGLKIYAEGVYDKALINSPLGKGINNDWYFDTLDLIGQGKLKTKSGVRRHLYSLEKYAAKMKLEKEVTGAPLTHPRSVNIKQLNKQGSVMNTLEKYAAKKKLTKKMIERLSELVYGVNPGTSGEVAKRWAGKGAKALGGLQGVAQGVRGGKVGGELGSIYGKRGAGAVAGAALNSAAGVIGGGIQGAILGGASGKLVGMSRAAKYEARKRLVNKRLALGAGAGGGLAALIAASKKRSK